MDIYFLTRSPASSIALNDEPKFHIYRDRFRFAALIFGPLFLIRTHIWLWGILSLICEIAFIAAVLTHFISMQNVSLSLSLMHLLIALEADQLSFKKQSRSKHVIDAFYGHALDAERRLYQAMVDDIETRNNGLAVIDKTDPTAMPQEHTWLNAWKGQP